MGNKTPNPESQSLLSQDTNFINATREYPKPFQIKYEFDDETESYVWKDNNIIIQQDHTNTQHDINCETSLIMSAGVHCGSNINHVLDGYSWAIVVNISNQDNKFKLIVSSQMIKNDNDLYLQEEQGHKLKTGLFTSDMSVCKKILLGNLFKLVSGTVAVERSTAHQPIYYPQKNTILFCSMNKYHSFTINNNSTFTENGWTPKFSKKEYACMHPHYDNTTRELLTYTFTHGILKKYTKVKFFAFGDCPDKPAITEYTIKGDRAALHMFGYTKHYYILFANSLKLEKGGEGKIIFGEPILRTLDDNYVGDLVIHFISRPSAKSRECFTIDTNHKGHVYHSINCFEYGEQIIIDAFVSNLNASRESAQFELSDGHNVYDNCGDPYRFFINIPNKQTPKNPCNDKLLASLIDSTIDFHCINSNYNGTRHKYSWILGHERVRDEYGNICKVISKLSKIYTPDNHGFDSDKTATHIVTSDEIIGKSCYWRTPLFIPNKNQTSDKNGEDDGYIFVWSYEFNNIQNNVCILILSAIDLQLISKIKLPNEYNIPYSVHSWIHH